MNYEQDSLFDWSEPYTVAAFDFAPEDITVRLSTVREIRIMQGRMGKGGEVWKPSPGRNLPFTVHVGEVMVGIGLLSSCVLNLGPRDAALDLPKDSSERGTALRHYMDLAVAIGAQPIAWHWNIGKLIALLATTMCPEVLAKYGDELRGVTSTSLWGKSSQYNRIYRLLGYTQGNGVMHIPQAERERMRLWVQTNAPDEYAAMLKRRSGAMSIVQLYVKVSGDKTWTTFHGQRRGIYYHPTTPASRTDVIAQWYERWGRPRWERTRETPPPYEDGIVWYKRKLTGG